eukprot:1404398-Alexandrium_andersonii.AAC.1
MALHLRSRPLGVLLRRLRAPRSFSHGGSLVLARPHAKVLMIAPVRVSQNTAPWSHLRCNAAVAPPSLLGMCAS